MNARTAILGVVLVVVAVVLLIVLSGGEDDGERTTTADAIGSEDSSGASGKKGDQGKPEPAAPRPLTIVVNGEGKPVGGVAEITVEKGEEVRFRVKSAVADHVHVHGYDLMKDVEPGRTVSFAFPAEIEGIFEAELEDRLKQILELRVEP